LERTQNKCVELLRDTQGQFGLWFAIAAMPILLTITVALDMTNAGRKRVALQSAVDNAALAAAANQAITDAERKQFTTDHFDQHTNILGKIDFSVNDASNRRVALEAYTPVEMTLGRAVGMNDFGVKVDAVAEVTEGEVVCIMALDPSGERTFEVTGGAKFAAETCSVQINSKHERAAIVDHGGEATAKDFCTTGGAIGKYIPYMNTECAAIKDPYENLRAPQAGPCFSKHAVTSTLSSWHAESREHGVTLTPGTYCGGLELKNKVVRFLPGTYIIKDGPLVFDEGSEVVAEGVTFVLSGALSTLEIDLGSKVNLSAPKTGKLAGLVFFQDTPRVFGKKPILPSGENIIRSGGNLSITGTGYFPEQKVSFRGGSLTEAQAPSTSFIAYQVSIGDGSKISVAVDHKTAGLPPILPRSDESVRLVE